MPTKGNRVSVSGTKTLPEYERRRSMEDFRSRVEQAVMRAWAKANIREAWIDHGHVPVDHLVPLVTRADGTDVLDPTALLAVNTTIQWLFGTNVGLSYARQFVEIEKRVAEEDRKRLAKIPLEQRTIRDVM